MKGAPDCRVITPLASQSPSAPLVKPLELVEERQLVDGAGHEALPPVEIGEAARGARVVLIVDPGKECHGSGGDIVNRFGPGIGALEIQPLAEAVGQGGLQSAVVGIGVGREVLEIRGGMPEIGRARADVFAVESMIVQEPALRPQVGAAAPGMVTGFCGVASVA